MNDFEKITFFMLVTNRDACIADYSIVSYQKLYTKYYDKIPFKLLVYANCITEKLKRIHFPRWQRFTFVEIIDNREKDNGRQFIPGEIIVSPEGTDRIREDTNENCDELWSTELKKIRTPYFATVDADFEILDPDFIHLMLESLDRDSMAIGMSTDYSPTMEKVYDSYSNRYITLHARWHTWFCIYKKDANKCTVSHFYYESKNNEGKLVCYDSSGYFQKRLIEDFGNKFLSISQEYKYQYVHYGAFSKNRSINAWNIGYYRFLFILSKRGLVLFHRIGMGESAANKAVKWVSKVLKKYLFNEEERTRYSFNLKK